jgi:hypothetical protein
LGRQRKPEDRALADPNYEGTAAADAALGTRFNRAGEEASRRPIPGQFLGEFLSVEIQARQHSSTETRESLFSQSQPSGDHFIYGHGG